ncbi:MAG: HAD family acid phosphatase [Terracidiphilus sp.]
MNKRFTILAAQFVLLFGTGWLAAQQSPRRAFSSDAQAERIPNLDTLKKELRQYHDCTCTCGCLAHDQDVQADRAIAFLRERAAHRHAQEKLALILDIDETTLSNYQEEVGADFAYNKPVFDAWVDTAQAPAIAGTLRLYKEAKRLGVSILFITGRDEAERPATERNLRAQGFDNWQELVMRPADHGTQSIGEFKQVARSQMIAKGYALALNVGDQWSDLKGKPEAEFSVKYPDPYYFIP